MSEDIIKNDNSIIKAESNKNTVPKTIIRQEIGQPRIVTSNRFIDDQRQTDLRMPTRLITYDNMYNDDCVYNSIDITNLLNITALYGGEFIHGPSESNKSKIAAEFLNYCIRNMSYGTYLEFLQNAVTDLKYGFSIQNIVIEKRNYGPYKGSYCLRKLSPRDQKSIYGWLWNKDQTELLGTVQSPRLTESRSFKPLTEFKDGLRAISVGKYYETDYPIIRTNQMLHFKYNSTNNNPQGDSPLAHCYTAWMEKRLIEEYEVIGVSKDLGGIVVLRVPADLIQKANDRTNYPAAYAEYQALQENAGDLHAGRSSFIVLTSDSDDNTKKYFYDMELKGIDGAGKQYNTSNIIDQKRKSIYNCFGTGFLLLGQDSVGSYNLSSNATSTHGYYVERNILQKVDVLNNQLAPRLLAANGIYLDYEDMPIYQPVSPTEVNKDELSKVAQRMGSVGLLTRAAITSIYTEYGWDLEDIEKLDLTNKGSSRAGESMGTSGTGSSQEGGGAVSTNNMENSDISKNLIFESEDDKQITLVDTKTGKPIFINK